MTYEGNCRLGDLFTSRREKGRAGLPTLSVTLNNGLVNREDLDRKQDTNLSPEEHLLVKPGDIVYNMMRMWQGAFGLADHEGLVSPAYVVLKAKKTVDPLFASYLLESPRMRHLLWAYSYGLTEDRLRLYVDDFKRIPADVPPLPQQRRIALGLTLWDRAIRNIEKLIEVLAKEKEAQRRRLLRLAQASSNPVPTKSLGELATFLSGGTPSKARPEYWGGPIPWISAKDMKSFYLESSELGISDVAKKTLRIAPRGAVLVLTRGMTLLRSVPICIATTELTFNQDVKALVPNAGVNSEYLAHALRAHEKQILGLVDTAGHGTGRLDTELLRQILIPLPPLTFQRAFAAAMSTFERMTSLYSRQREHLILERKALLGALVHSRPSVFASALQPN